MSRAKRMDCVIPNLECVENILCHCRKGFYGFPCGKFGSEQATLARGHVVCHPERCHRSRQTRKLSIQQRESRRRMQTRLPS